jgi:hypothetical protein
MAEFFDKKFRLSLIDIVFDGRLPRDICEAIHVDNSSRVIKNDRLRAIIYRFNYVVFSWMSDFCRLKFGNFSGNSKVATTFREKLIKLVRERSRKTDKKWPYLILILYIVCTVMLSINIYYQYIYHANTLRLIKIQAYMNDRGKQHLLEHLNVTRLESEFKLRANAALHMLKTLGTSCTEWRFIIESVVLVYIISSLNLFVVIPLSYRLNGWLFLTPLLMLDPKDESNVRARLILEELEMFSINSLACARTKMEQFGKDLANLIRNGDFDHNSKAHLCVMADKALIVLSKRLEQKHNLIIRQLKTIALGGRLNPLNRSTAWRDRLAISCCMKTIITFVIMQVIAGVRNKHMSDYFKSKGLEYKLDGFKDYFSAFSIVFLVEVHALTAVFLGLILISTWNDHNESLRLLRELILSTIKKNTLISHRLIIIGSQHQSFKQSPDGLMGQPRTRRYASVAFLPQIAPHQDYGKDIRERFEQDLMTVFIHYRIVTRTFELTRSAMSWFAFGAIWFVAVLLVVFRLHGPYFQELKPLNLASGIVSIICGFVYLVPLGLMHQRFIKTFKELWNLAAQMSHFETVAAINRCLRIDSNVTVFCIRRDLADSRQRMDRIACKVLSLPITNNNLIKILFWACLIVASLSNNLNILGEGLESFTNDPFGIYDFLTRDARIEVRN